MKGKFFFILLIASLHLGTTFVLMEGDVQVARWEEEDGTDTVEVIDVSRKAKQEESAADETGTFSIIPKEVEESLIADDEAPVTDIPEKESSATETHSPAPVATPSTKVIRKTQIIVDPAVKVTKTPLHKTKDEKILEMWSKEPKKEPPKIRDVTRVKKFRETRTRESEQKVTETPAVKVSKDWQAEKEKMFRQSTRGEASTQDDWLWDHQGHDNALGKQQRNKKPIMLYFHAPHSPYTKRFERDVLSSNLVQKYLSPFTKVKINADKERKLYRQYRIQTYPAFLVRGKSGKLRRIYADQNPELFIKECKKAVLKLTY